MTWDKLSQNDRLKRFMMLALLASAITLSACWQGSVAPSRADQVRMPGGDAERGWQLLQDYGCMSCHTIPGVPRANTTVGPPLNFWAERHYIAGRLVNTPENLMLWIQFPQSVDPGNAMPDMGVTEQDARDMGAYLYSLRRNGWNEFWWGPGRRGRWASP